MEDPYEVLGLIQGASVEKAAIEYRKLAKLFHPDRNPGDVNAAFKFRRIHEAFEKIKLSKNVQGLAFLKLTVEEAFFGCEKEVALNDPVCGLCVGTGCQTLPCQTCLTLGFIGSVKNGMRHELSCPNCKTAGYLFEDCKECQGSGLGQVDIIRVKIDPETKPGTFVRCGLAMLPIVILSHKYFKFGRMGLEIEVPITPAEAMCSAIIKVPVPGSFINIKLNPGILNGDFILAKDIGKDGIIIRFKIITDITPEVAKEYEVAALFVPKEVQMFRAKF